MTELPAFVNTGTDLAQPRLGASVISASDEFFAARERLIEPAEPVFIADRYDEHGKWMDGWESRRRRQPGHDHCVVRICRGVVRGVDIDTRHFTGNYPPAASLQAWCGDGDADPGERAQWHTLIESVSLQGNSQHFFAVTDTRVWTHLRLNIFPDGGVARLRVYGDVEFDWSSHEGEVLDLAAMAHGGRALSCNDMHYGHIDNLIAPGNPKNMGDGWETRRRREPGNDWVILQLGQAGEIRRVLVDTAFFKGNYPSHCTLSGVLLEDGAALPDADSPDWKPILPNVSLQADHQHEFVSGVIANGPVSHVRFDIFPDGGVGRLRLYGVMDTA
jgi:allantoicase